MTKIWDRLYLGSFKDAEQLATTNPLRIRAVVSLCEEEVTRASSIIYAHLPISDARPIPTERFDEIMTAMERGLRKGNLFVHCLGGASRSPIMVAAWLQRCGYAGIDKALAEISEVLDIQPSPTLLRNVRGHLSR